MLIKQLSEIGKPHPDSKIVVCGCGMSLLSFTPHNQKFITIGVNDVPFAFDPTYMLVTDHPGRFSQKRRDMINKSRAKYLFTCAKGWRHPNMVHFELGSKEVRSLDNPKRIDHFVNSPFVAVGLAYKLGAKHIGLVGVDFTDGHFYNPNDGAHPVMQINYLKRVNTAYGELLNELTKRGVSFYNLSAQSRVTIPKITIEEFEKL